MAEVAPDVFSPLIEQAIELAAEWHEGTYRKSRWREVAFTPPLEELLRVPSIAHATAVGMILQRSGWDEATVAAGFLHDVLEDANRFGQLFGYEELRRSMGEAVADRVRGVTEQKWDEEGRPLAWRTRKERYLEGIRQGSTESMAISLADKLHNLWSMNQAIRAGVDIFSPAPGRRALNAGPEAQAWFASTVLEASRVFADPRLDALRNRLAREIERFRTLTGEPGRAPHTP